MRYNYFAKLVKYMKNVYNIERHINKLSDGRKNPKYKTAQIITPLLLGFMLRIKSMNGLKLIARVNIQEMAAMKKTALLIGPSGKKLQINVASPASPSSAIIPAAPIERRLRREMSFQDSLVSVNSTGHMTRKATPILGTFTP